MIGQTLAHYVVKARLGAGGMGEVFRVEDTRLDRDVALKVLLPEFARDEGRLRRFRREAQLLAALDHPGIVTIFSVEEADGVQFLTMQLVEGQSLDRIIPPGGLPLRRFFDIALPLVDALAAAHAQGVIHRDLKPSNVMCTPGGRVKVLDFGLARVSNAAPGEATDTLSHEGQAIGTLPYMSPEQLAGIHADARTDVFSLGVLLYEIATGHRPFGGETSVDLLTAILTATPRSIRDVRSDYPMEVSAIVERCLAKRSDERMASARELHLALQRVAQRGAPGSMQSESTEPVTMTASIAVLPFTSLSSAADDQYFADGTAEEIINALGRLPDVKVAARTSSFAFKGRPEDLRTIGEKLGVATILEGSVRRSGHRLRVTAQLVDAKNGYHLWSERYDRELADVFDVQDEIARSKASRLTTTLLSGSGGPLVRHGTTDVEAFRLYTQGRTWFDKRTGSGMQRAIPYFQQAIERDMNYALAWAGLADTLVLLEDYQLVESGSLVSAAEEAVRRALELDPNLAEAHASMGVMQTLLRNGPAAVQALQHAVSLRPAYAHAHNWLAWILVVLGRREEALKSAKRSVELNPLAPEPLSNLALAQLANGDLDEALRTARRGQEIEPDFESNRFYEALALCLLRKFDEAAGLLRKTEVTWAPTAPLVVLGMTEAGMQNLDPTRAIVEKLRAAGDPAGAGIVLAALGEPDEALSSFGEVARWEYWATIAIHNFFDDVLGPVRADRRFGAVRRAVDASWQVPHVDEGRRS